MSTKTMSTLRQDRLATRTALSAPLLTLGFALVALSARSETIRTTATLLAMLAPLGLALLVARIAPNPLATPLAERLLRVGVIFGSFLTCGVQFVSLRDPALWQAATALIAPLGLLALACGIGLFGFRIMAGFGLLFGGLAWMTKIAWTATPTLQDALGILALEAMAALLIAVGGVVMAQGLADRAHP